MLVFPGQNLTPQQHVAFAKRFGEIETDTAQGRKVSQGRIGKNFADVSNLDHQGKIWEKDSRQRRFQLCNRPWHTDRSFTPPPAPASLPASPGTPPLRGPTPFAGPRPASGVGEGAPATPRVSRVTGSDRLNLPGARQFLRPPRD